MHFKQYTILLARRIPKIRLNQIKKISTEPIVLTAEIGKAGVVILNRPKSLNAINSNLNLKLLESLKKFEKTKSLVIIKGAGRAFCAGGDILENARASRNRETDEKSSEFVIKLHELLYVLHTFKIPVVTFMNGIAFGAGAALGVFSRYTIATENTRFSMPEVKFGFHPNAGASYFLNQYNNGYLGYFLALTGFVMRGADVVRANYATHFCHNGGLKKLEEDLLNCSNQGDVENVIESMCERNIPECSFSSVMDKINNCFSEATIESVIGRLEKDNSSWAKSVLEIMGKCSPTSLKVTLRQLQKGEDMELSECFAMESNLSYNFYNYTDVLEGTKSILVNKTYIPKWNPAKLSEVTEDLVESHFQSVNDVKQRQILRNRLMSL